MCIRDRGSDKRMTGTQGEGGVSMQIPTMAALSRAFQAKEEPLSEEEQFKKDARAKGASEEAIALAVRMKFRSEWEQSLTPDEERKQARMEEAGASEKAIKHSIQMDRSAREKGFKNQAEYLASIPEKGETKPALTYDEGWQINKGGGWEDVADQKVPTIMGEKGLSTLSHVRYRQKGTTQQSSSTSSNAASSLASSLKSVQKKDTDREQGTGGIQSSLSLISSFLPKATATVSGDGTSAQLTMQLAGAGRIGQKTIIINATTDSSSSFSTSVNNTETHQKAMSINNNHTQPPQTGRDA